MTENQPEKPKIVVDEDWKAQVEAERDALRQKEEEAQPEQAHEQQSHEQQAPEQQAPEAEAAAAGAGSEGRLPPASFGMLVSSLATQAIVSLGQIPDPVENKPVVRLEMARHFIDTLAVLEDKTRGNLTPEESKMLSGALHELRMLFVATKGHSPQPPEQAIG